MLRSLARTRSEDRHDVLNDVVKDKLTTSQCINSLPLHQGFDLTMDVAQLIRAGFDVASS